MMKKKLCNLIFKKELNEAYMELESNYQFKILEVNAIKRKYEKRYELINNIFSRFQNAEIIGIDKNKNNE